MIRHAPTTWTVILPGVVDLRSPQPGLDPHHRSVRDLDVGAVGATLSPDPTGDVYAVMVAEALERAEVPPGSDILLVGHSYGAGAAVRLAASPSFNGDRYDVSHVLATGYHADPWLDAVPASTAVLVVQNRRDLVVAAEAAAHGAVPFLTGSPEDPDEVVQFDGGWGDAGHHQRHYLDHLDATQSPHEQAFMTAMAARGYTAPGEAWAVDVSVPVDR